jgi:trimeric autotransporter adhesin
MDLYGNTWDVTALTTWSASYGAGGSWFANTYTAERVGSWVVTGIFGQTSATTSLAVTRGNIYGLIITPSTTQTAGSSQSYSATATDIYHNTWDVTSQTTWNITTGAGGSWSNNVYTSAGAGQWTVSGTYSGYTNTTTLIVTHTTPTRLTINTTLSSIIAGSSATFTAFAQDTYGNPWEVTQSVVWNMSSGAGGSWNGNSFVSEKAGSFMISGTFAGLSSTTLLTVIHSSLASIALSPQTSSIPAGSNQIYTIAASDVFGNTWDVTPFAHLSIDDTAQGSWLSNSYSSAKAGTWTVTGTYSGLSTIASLTVIPGAAVRITLNPPTSTIIAGETETYTTTATDSFANSWDCTSSASMGVDPMASGSFDSEHYTSMSAGTWTITGSSLGLFATATLTVVHSDIVAINVTPSTSSINAGESQTFVATASDQYGNMWDVSDETNWSSAADAHGSWNANQYISSTAGNWQITGTYSGISNNALLTVNHADAVSIRVFPEMATISAGSNETFSALASDLYSNTWAISEVVTWNITSSAGGLWTNNLYSSANAGTWIVTATCGILQDTSSLMVEHGSPMELSISLPTLPLPAGSNQTLNAYALDSNGNRWEVTDNVQWSIDSTAGGSWEANKYLSEIAGQWTITGSYQGLSAATPVTVIPGDAVALSISASSTLVNAGSSITFTVIAIDSCGNTWDVTDVSNWSIDSAADGSWTGNVYTSALAGFWNVSCSSVGLSTAVFITVNHAEAIDLSIDPSNAIIMAGSTQVYSAVETDSFGNSWDVTNLADWNISLEAQGSWTANAYLSAQAGIWVVTAVVDNLSGECSLTVNHGQANHLEIAPKSQAIQAGISQTFTATAYDTFGNNWAVSDQTIWRINQEAKGRWVGNSYTSSTAGTWFVEADFAGLMDSALLTVEHGPTYHIVINPESAFITAGDSQAYTALAIDLQNNQWEITDIITWLISVGAGGDWSQNIYTSQNSGNWTVTGQSEQQSDNASLTVYYRIDFNHDGTVDYLDTIYFSESYSNFNQNHAYNSVCDLNLDGRIDFLDLVDFASLYNVYYQSH